MVMIRIKEQRVSRLAHRPGESAQAENLHHRTTKDSVFSDLLSDIDPPSAGFLLPLDEGPPGGRRTLANLPET